jgi:hypothetical protein
MAGRNILFDSEFGLGYSVNDGTANLIENVPTKLLPRQNVIIKFLDDNYKWIRITIGILVLSYGTYIIVTAFH